MSPAPKKKRSGFTSTRVGGLRPSQMIYTYGPGAPVDLPGMSVVIAGTDRWDVNHTERIVEPRLLGAVRAVARCEKVAEFRTPPWQDETGSPYDEWARIGVPVLPFPRWLRCTGCDLLAPVDHRRFTLDVPLWRPDRSRYYHDKCRGRRPSAVPARFLIACPAGHLDDFPWSEYVHRGGPCPHGGALLELKEAGKANRATDVRVNCTMCGADRHLQDAFGPDGWRSLPECRGRHPHIFRFEETPCREATRALILGASNAWFAVYRSALTLPTASGRIQQKVAEHWEDLADIEDRDEFDLIVRRLQKGKGERALRWLLHFDPDDIWTAVTDRRGGGSSDPGVGDLRGPEWEALTSSLPPASDDFLVRHLAVPKGFANRLDGPVAVDRLREVMALCGFTRLEGPDDAGSARRVAPLWASSQTWLPAAETRGEGLLLRLPEAKVEQWEADYRKTERFAELVTAHRAWRSRRGLDPRLATPTARQVLLHSFSHMVLHQVALHCGYSTASVRERLYAREPGDPLGPPMAGVLLYTASPDSEGTLGGLVALAEPERLSFVLREAIRRAKVCSTDPMCAGHRAGDQGDSLHGAACHACLFAPETSCETGNRYLDRAAVVATLGGPSRPWFA